MSDDQKPPVKPKTAQELLREHYAEQDRLAAEHAAAAARAEQEANKDNPPFDPANPPTLAWNGIFKPPVKPGEEAPAPPEKPDPA